MKEPTKLFAALAVSATLCACVDEPMDEALDPDAGTIEEVEVDKESMGVFEVGMVWDEDDLTVCWEADAMADELSTGRAQVRIASHRWEAVTRINFVGWDACATTVNPDIRIGNTDVMSTSELGISSRGDAPSMRINLGCVVPENQCLQEPTEPIGRCNGIMTTNGEPPPLAECVRTLAVHELGHALGLRHEQVHSDDPCGNRGETLDGVGYDGEDLWSYDPSSVMSYCTWSDQLAPGDVKAITSLYPSQVMVYADANASPIATRVVVGPGRTYASAVPGLQTGESIVVSAGLTARVCSYSGCLTYYPGKHELSYAVKNDIYSITVTPKISVHTSRGFRGTAYEFANGWFHAQNGTLPAGANDNIESVYVGHNFDVRMCSDVSRGWPSGTCGTFSGGPEWDQAVFVKLGLTGFDNTASHVEVIPKVAFYNEPAFRGTGATFRVGTYYPGAPFTSARSVAIPPALYIYACDDVNSQGGPAGNCRVYNDSLNLPADHAGRLKYVNISYK